VTLVSVIIPVYNRASLLPRALESVAAQTGIPLEIIVVDDASTDGTAEAVRKWCRVSSVECQDSTLSAPHAPLVRRLVRRSLGEGGCAMPPILVTLPRNAGPAAARNRGLAEATGEYVAFLDSDDEWLPGSLSLRVEALRRHDDLDLLFCDFENREDGGAAPGSFLHTRNVWPDLRFVRGDDGVCLPENLFECQLIQPLVATPTVVVRARCLNGKTRFDERLRVAEDWEFWLRFSRHHRVGFLDQVLVRRHLQDDNLTRNPSGWFEANIAAGRIILEEYELPASQRRFVRRRLAADCFDLGYHLCRQVGDLKHARRRLAASLLCRPSWKALKWLMYAVARNAKVREVESRE